MEKYKELIKNAQTSEELRKISYQAFLEDEAGLSGERTLYNKVVSLCVKRELELGICKYAPPGYDVKKCPHQLKNCRRQCKEVSI